MKNASSIAKLLLFVKSEVLHEDICVIDFLKISLPTTDTYLKVKDRHFEISTKEQLQDLSHQD